jgi:hypothetical protein
MRRMTMTTIAHARATTLRRDITVLFIELTYPTTARALGDNTQPEVCH